MEYHLLERKMLSATENGRYNYCPICYRKLKQSNPDVNYKDVIKPLIFYRYLIIEGVDHNGKEIKYFDDFWECSRCSKKYSLNELVDCYHNRER